MSETVQDIIKSWVSKSDKDISFNHSNESNISLGISKGTKRSQNQDRVVVCTIPFISDALGKVFCVLLSDGMGGMRDGDICADLTISCFISSMMKSDSNELKVKILNSIKYANDKVFSIYKGNGGATLSVLVVDDKNKVYSFNIGDSRIYLVTHSNVRQISIDDTLNGRLDALKENKNERLSEYKQLLQYIGVGQELEPNEVIFSRNHDFIGILIASDGINKINNDLMSQIILHSSSPKDISQRLIYLANWLGGEDNASIAYIPKEAINSSNIFLKNIENSCKIFDAYQRELTLPMFFNMQSSDDVNQKDKKSINKNSRKGKKKKNISQKDDKQEVSIKQQVEKPKIEIKINTEEDSE